MKKFTSILAVLVFIMAFMPGCKKDTDNAAKWVGTYVGTAGYSNTVNQITISEVNSTTLKIELQTPYAGTFITFVTISNAKLVDATNASVNEDGYILPDATTVYHFNGSGHLSGNTLTFSGTGTNSTNPSDVKGYAFTGSK
jgi:hypothetical protein